MEYCIVYDRATGQELYPLTFDRPGAGALQTLPDGTGLVVVPPSVAQRMPRDLVALRATMVERIDAEAERVRALFVTALPGQVGTYVLKEAAARAWLADSSASTLMLAPEAEARSMTIADLAAEVVAHADAWTHLSGLIEGARFGAKVAVAAADTIGGVAEAARIDWSAVLPA